MRDKIFTILSIIIVIILFVIGKNALENGEIDLYVKEENEINNKVVNVVKNNTISNNIIV